MGYKMLDAGADAGIIATAHTLEGLFREAALGMYSISADLEFVKASEVVKVEVKSHSLDGLLVVWLNELVYLLDTRGFVASGVEVTSLDEDAFSLGAILAGACLDSERLGHGLMIKAATYHGLSIVKNGGIWSAEVMFDI